MKIGITILSMMSIFASCNHNHTNNKILSKRSISCGKDTSNIIKGSKGLRYTMKSKRNNYIPPKLIDTLPPESTCYLQVNINNQTINSVDTSNFTICYIVIKSDTNKVYSTIEVDEQPIFPGGNEALIHYIELNTNRPSNNEDINEIIYVRFVIDKMGKVTDVNVIRSTKEELEKEAIRVIKSMPQWIPGKINSKPVNTSFIVPIKFK